MSESQPRTILLGITGSIEAYNGLELVGCLRKRGVEVRVVLPRDAQHFVSVLACRIVAGQVARNDPRDDGSLEAGSTLVEFARRVDHILVAPATARFIAHLALGFAQDFLTTIALTTVAPIVLAPAMNRQIWTNPQTQANVGLLRTRGVRVLDLASGDRASGEMQDGRMLEPSEIVAELFSAAPANAAPQSLRPIVTAGCIRKPDRPAAPHQQSKLRLVSSPARGVSPPKGGA